MMTVRVGGFMLLLTGCCLAEFVFAQEAVVSELPKTPSQAVPVPTVAEQTVVKPVAGETAASSSGVRVVYLSSRGPLLLQFTLTVNGQAWQPSLKATTDQLFTLLDKNNDGQLDAAERKRIPTSRALQSLQVITRSTVLTSLLQSDSRSKVSSREDLLAYFEKLGLQGFRVSSVQQASGNQTRAEVIVRPGQAAAPSPRISERLIAYVDTDHDGRLSTAELMNVETLLRKVDLDFDEIYSSREFLVIEEETRQASRSPGPPKRNAGTTDRFCLVSGQSPTALQNSARTCAVFYHSQPEAAPQFSAELPRESTRLSADVFNTLDRERNGVISTEDWLAWFETAPVDLQIAVAFGKEASSTLSTERLTVQPRESLQIGPLLPVASGGRDAMIDGARLQFRFADNQLFRSPDDFLKDVFLRLDRDKNDYIDRNEAARLNGLDFREMDADGNGMVFLEEFLTGGAPICMLADQLLALTIDASGFDLFAAVDANQDSRWSVREIRTLPQQFLQWDRNGDGTIDADELPTYFTLLLSYGLPADSLTNARQALQSSPPVFLSPSQPTPGRPDNRPPWFLQMDRNNDGDISRREFLGKLELFEQWDTDHDGLLSVGEVQATVNPDRK